jgi:hypothetical protein
MLSISTGKEGRKEEVLASGQRLVLLCPEGEAQDSTISHPTFTVSCTDTADR